MSKRPAYRVKMLRNFTFRPPNDTTWHRKFKEGWSGPVPEAQYEAIMAAEAAECVTPKAKPTKSEKPEQADSENAKPDEPFETK